MSHAMQGHPRWPGHGEEFWQNRVHWRREYQATSVFLPWEPQEQYEKEKNDYMETKQSGYSKTNESKMKSKRKF